MPKIIYKNKDAVVIIKPLGIPSQPDPSGDKDALFLTEEALRKMGEPEKLWLVHRLDRTVSGVLVFARNKQTAAKLSALVSDGSMGKTYYAVTEGVPEAGEYSDFLFKDSSQSKAFIVKSERRGAKKAVLDLSVLDMKETAGGKRTLVRVELKTGRFHQIRAQLSHRGTPLVGDGKYGSRDKGRRTPALFASSISLPSVFGKDEILAKPDLSEYPWNLFDTEKYV